VVQLATALLLEWVYSPASVDPSVQVTVDTLGLVSAKAGTVQELDMFLKSPNEPHLHLFPVEKELVRDVGKSSHNRRLRLVVLTGKASARVVDEDQVDPVATSLLLDIR
jgi:hypothetical protein